MTKQEKMAAILAIAEVLGVDLPESPKATKATTATKAKAARKTTSFPKQDVRKEHRPKAWKAGVKGTDQTAKVRRDTIALLKEWAGKDAYRSQQVTNYAKHLKVRA